MYRLNNSEKYIQRAGKLLGLRILRADFFGEENGFSSLVIKSARGSKIVDEDNNVYTDYCLSSGALILGHAHRNVVLAAKKTAERGICFDSLTRHEIELADHIVKKIPSIDIVRFTESSRDAVRNAINLSMRFTKREMVVCFEGCFNGNLDVSIGEGKVITIPFNNIDVLENTFKKHRDSISCVLIEPVATRMGVVAANREFLKVIRALTEKFGIVLIFDEAITGFRCEQGSFQIESGINADITCFGNVIGGGFELGAYGGKKEIIQCMDDVAQRNLAEILFRNPVIMKAGLAALRLLNKDFIRSLNEKCWNLTKRLNEFFRKNDINAHFSCYKSILNIYFKNERVSNYGDAKNALDKTKYCELIKFLFANRIYFPQSGLNPFFVSGLHSKKDLEQLGDVIEEFFSN